MKRGLSGNSAIRGMLQASLFVMFLALLACFPAQDARAAITNDQVNLLPTACYFYTDRQDNFPSMLPMLEKASCEGAAAPSKDMVWLSLDVAQLQPQANTAYSLVVFREWVERTVVQIQYSDGHMVAYDVAEPNFDSYWSVGNFLRFDAPSRNAAVSNVILGLQNPTAIKTFRQINFVDTLNWEQAEAEGRMLVAIIIGILLAMLCYNISLATVLRFDFHLHYCIFVFSVLLYNVSAYGLMSHFLPGQISLAMQMNLTILALGLNGFSGLHFLISFIEKGIFGPRWRKTAQILAYTFMASALLYVATRGWHANLIDLWFNLMSGLGVVFILVALIKALVGGSRAALFYTVGWILPIVGVVLRVLRGFEIIPHSSMVEYSMSIGMALETIILSIGIADRISQIRKDRDEARLAGAKARAASQAKSDFLAQISHEIRTPMNAIIGMSELVALTKLDEKQKDYVRNIQISGNVLMTLLNDVLDLSKIEAGKVDLESIEFTPREIFRNVEAIAGPKAREKGLEFCLKGVESLPEALTGDPTRLSQILINLTNNAVKFTDKGSITVSVKGEEQARGRMALYCTVTDTGVGMTTDQQSRLFKAFSQADETITRKYGGTGLGLAICKQLVDLMGGVIWVESAQGQGSSFHFRLPYKYDASAQAKPAEVTPSPEEANNDLGASPDMRILLVEDNEINQVLAQNMLEPLGVHTDIASSGEEALDHINGQAYDLILMDLNMPGMNGIETTQAVRANPAYASVPIIALTASTTVDDIEACLDGGMDDHLAKPFKPDALYEMLARWMPQSS